ncbi:hypothetical protein AB0A05_38705 [Streptomyces sp. NPDC046374]
MKVTVVGMGHLGASYAASLAGSDSTPSAARTPLNAPTSVRSCSS